MEHLNHLLMGLLTGALFGIVLHKVGAIRYSRVEGMLLLRDLKIMKFAFMGIATASIIYGLADIFGIAEQTNLLPRIMPYLGIAHLVGGFLFGIAMASAGFCPGTCVARVGAGKFISFAGVIGLILGIVIYTQIQPWLVEVGILGTREKITSLRSFRNTLRTLGCCMGCIVCNFCSCCRLVRPSQKDWL
ncbi:MAG: YeeE/YedE thiosulfate transporter family protein [Persephonella sp.]|nr:YeeE/YedE thiosulfate transporter family protein [Persephonella sp.]